MTAALAELVDTALRAHVDEPRARWRTGHQTESSLRWVAPPAVVFDAVLELRRSSNVVELAPTEAARVFEGFSHVVADEAELDYARLVA